MSYVCRESHTRHCRCTVCTNSGCHCTSGRFVKQEQWERWLAKQKLVSAFGRARDGCGRGSPFPLRSPGVLPQKIFFAVVYAKSCNLVHFGWKMVCNAVHPAFLNTLTMGTAFLLEMTSAL